jgi:hypothetical protein
VEVMERGDSMGILSKRISFWEADLATGLMIGVGGGILYELPVSSKCGF